MYVRRRARSDAPYQDAGGVRRLSGEVFKSIWAELGLDGVSPSRFYEE